MQGEAQDEVAMRLLQTTVSITRADDVVRAATAVQLDSHRSSKNDGPDPELFPPALTEYLVRSQSA